MTGPIGVGSNRSGLVVKQAASCYELVNGCRAFRFLSDLENIPSLEEEEGAALAKSPFCMTLMKQKSLPMSDDVRLVLSLRNLISDTLYNFITDFRPGASPFLILSLGSFPDI